LQQSLNDKAERQTRLLGSKHTAEQAAAAKEIEAITTDYQQVCAQIRTRSPRYAALTQPQPLTLKEMQQQLLDADTLLLEYARGDQRSYLWAVTPDGMQSYELPKRAEIEKAARRVHDLLTAPKPPDEIDTVPVAPAIVSFVLAAGLVRDTNNARQLIIPHNARQIRLQLLFRQGEYPGYRAVLCTAAGREALNQRGLKAQMKGAGRVVILQASAEGFASGDYILTLEGITATGEAEVVAEYAFTVVKK
jgi:hypothetical protein